MSSEAPRAVATDAPVVVGKIRGIYGVRGWFKVFSYTRPRENLLRFDPWMIQGPSGWVPCRVVGSGRSGGELTVQLDLAQTRTGAQKWIGMEIAIRRDQLPRLPAGQYYWSDLVGLRVRSRSGVEFGRVTELLETGANDVLAVAGAMGRILIPFVPGRIVDSVDIAAGVILVDWDPEYR
ncbi:MAG: 16S rRNA processing protein RimM [Gammaproteobacteria bacterium]|nr:16S rRNA processing protein RimM [Gammaproteobacteria bacterium]